jgi:polyhydroxybutyrate depolymerase
VLVTKTILTKIIAAGAITVALTAPALAACAFRNVVVYDINRTALVCTPDNAPGPWPVLLAFHGRASDGYQMAVATRLHEAWPEAVVVYPYGLTGSPGPINQDGAGWQSNPGENQDRDVAFTDAILRGLAQYYPVDPQRVFAVGHSNGARMASVLWVLRGRYFTSFAFSAAQADTLIQSSPPRSVFMGMGLNDVVAPFDWQKQSIGYAATLLQVDTGATPIAYTEGVQRLTGQTGLELMTLIHTYGHDWPAGQSKMIVEFFKPKTKPLN